jgi:hypothetical protein
VSRKLAWGLAGLLLASGAAGAMVTAKAAAAEVQRDRQQQTRSLVGQVTDRDNQPLPDSLVYLKNLNTGAVRTYIANKEGNYEFHALSPNVDYEVFAEFEGQRSQTRVLSAFDSRPRTTLNLRIDVKKQ